MATFDYTNTSAGLKKMREYIDAHTPSLSTAASLTAGPMGWMTLDGAMPTARTLNNHKPTMVPPQAPSPSPAAPSAPAAPMANPANWGVSPGAMSAAPGSSWVDSTKPPTNLMPPAPAAAPAPAPQAPQAPPMPQAPQAQAPAPQQPDMGFFARNAAMMRDPGTGQFIDPAGAAQAQATRGPDLINKMMALLHDKATG